MSRRSDAEMRLAEDARGHAWTVVVPGKRYVEELRASAALAAAGAYTLTNPIDVFKSKLLHLFVSVNASATGNVVSIIPEVSLDPDGGDNTFFALSVAKGAATKGNLGTSPGGSYTEHNFGSVEYLPMNITTPGSVGATDKLRMVVSLDVNAAYWIRFRVAESGVTATPAALALSYSKST